VRAKPLSKERLKEISVKIAGMIEEEVERELGRAIELTEVSINMQDEWPYSLNVEVSVSTKFDVKDLKGKLEDALEKALRKAAEMLRKTEGLEELI